MRLALQAAMSRNGVSWGWSNNGSSNTRSSRGAAWVSGTLPSARRISFRSVRSAVSNPATKARTASAFPMEPRRAQASCRISCSGAAEVSTHRSTLRPFRRIISSWPVVSSILRFKLASVWRSSASRKPRVALVCPSVTSTAIILSTVWR